jgi:formylglycine-generating enzyme required for sulfatase activity
VTGHANINETANKVGPHYLQKSSAVGMYPQGASHYGVLDMGGNLWEWCLNEYERPDHSQEEGDATRVVRGGSWTFNDALAAASFRDGDSLDQRADNVGVRVVVVGSVPVG